MHSLSSKHTSLEVELEGIILQHTAAVDYYLETAAAKWTLGAVERATPRALREVFLADLKSTLWQESAQSRVSTREHTFFRYATCCLLLGTVDGKSLESLAGDGTVATAGVNHVAGCPFCRQRVRSDHSMSCPCPMFVQLQFARMRESIQLDGPRGGLAYSHCR